MSINFEVASKTPKDVSAIGIAVSTDGAMPKEVSLSRKALEALTYHGNDSPRGQILNREAKYAI